MDDPLSHPLVWRGRDGGSDRSSDKKRAVIPTGFSKLDHYLPGGGWPLDGLTEVFVERYGIGELSLLMPALALLSHRPSEPAQWIVWIAPPFVPYAPALLRHGIDLSRILLVHPEGSRVDALWASEQVIKSRSSVAMLAWLEEADMTALRRLQLGAEAQACWTVLFRPEVALSASSPAALRVRLSLDSTEAEPGRVRLEIRKCRGRRPRTITLEDLRAPEQAPDGEARR